MSTLTAKRALLLAGCFLAVVACASALSAARALLNMRSDAAVDVGMALIAVVGIAIWLGAGWALTLWRKAAPKGRHDL